MQLKDYAEKIRHLCLYPEARQGTVAALCYTGLGLAGEAGEVANQIKKILRDDGGQVTPQRREKLLSELGDVAWYFVRLCEELQLDLDHVLEENVKKLYDRRDRGSLVGDGDTR